MPKTPVDYSKTIIYKLVHKDDLNDENIYVGSTTSFKHRKTLHKSRCNNPNNKEHYNKKYQYIRENGGWCDWCMIEIEKYPCKDVNEATARERFWKRELNATLNMVEPNRSRKEWREDNKDKRKQQYQDNKDKILERKKQRYQDNKDKILEECKQKVICEICGCESTKHHLARHKKTAKCKMALEKKKLSYL